MIFRYDFGEVLDLSRFRKQAAHYINNKDAVLFEIYMRDFKITLKTAPDFEFKSNNSKISFASSIEGIIRIFSLKRINGEIVSIYPLSVTKDNRFALFPDVRSMFDNMEVRLIEEESEKIVDSMCKVITATHRIRRLELFV